ncbi:HAMP domain-containing histidine kinase [Bdellovibrio bacteriovorus]|uniref:sensor histidine kinase n=1 Tax=Bdellovibrio bacteriovorus TaxID=959 RepID=UPI0021CDFB3A|nr:HAMP domain-containing sensor histidine kinase [Bdellovibrio bacteriovorus]UXR65496.1 HAMP domain-containing histidine kinase [Bdellovibrio bacteriovorus]
MGNTKVSSQNGISGKWLTVFVLVSLAVAVLSFTFEVQRARSSVQQYVGIWEDDIARAKLFQGDPGLQNKILSQLKEVHTAVVKSEVQKPESLQCLFSTQVPITLNSLPAGSIAVCFGTSELAVKAVTSPLFMLGLVLGLVFLGWSYRREFMARLHEQKLESELALSREISEISRQVAHDIRGPLMALTTLSQLSHEMSSEKKELFDHAVSRIKGIAEDLLSRSRKSVSPESAVTVAKQQDLTALLESLLKEYRFSNPQVDFTWHKHIHSASVKVLLDSVKLQRVVSNLLNNSLEALPEKEASINMTLMERQDHWLLQIMDNGCGIPEEVLPQLTQEGVSYGKEKGNGLGLYDAKKSLEAVGGDLQIRSRVGVGTQVILSIPKAPESALDPDLGAAHS